jgi:hypothetical protein
MTERIKGECLRLSLSASDRSRSQSGSGSRSEISGLARDLTEQVSQFYGDGRKVICGLGLRGDRLACSVFRGRGATTAITTEIGK